MPVAEDPPAKEDLVGSFIALQNTLPTSEKTVLAQLQSHPKEAARFSRAVKAYAATQVGVAQKK